MQITKIEGKGVSLIPVTAMEEYFIWFLIELINAKNAEVLKECDALRSQFHSQGSQPSSEGPQS